MPRVLVSLATKGLDFPRARVLAAGMRFATVGEYENARSFVPRANEENVDRLEAHLANGGS